MGVTEKRYQQKRENKRKDNSRKQHVDTFLKTKVNGEVNSAQSKEN